jgi:S-DNA-T family DNA segregation ATPase FtsK/SpoIIIE
MSGEAKRSMAALGLFFGAVVIFLSILGLAGAAGVGLDRFLAALFGWSRLILPVLALILGVDIVTGQRRLMHITGVVAAAALLLGLSGLFNLVLALPPAPTDQLASAGGMLGQVLSVLVAGYFGVIVATLFGVGLLVLAAILFLNLSLAALFDRPMAWARAEDVVPADGEEDDGRVVQFVGEEVQEDVSEVEEEIEDEEIEVDDEEAPVKKIHVPAETVMTSSERRTIEVPLDLLDDKKSEPKSGDVVKSQEIIIKALDQFGIPVEMADVKVGPTVTQYSFRPAQGVKLSRIVALQNDLALALAAHPIRIEAPIPGKALVGIEVPNQTVARVSLRELLESSDFQKRKSSFSVPLGKDISGSVPLLQVERAPHMLVAGATGSGKSVCLNTIIISLLYQNGPDDLKLIMVDPKRVELGIYAGIPHLLVPPIVKAEEAVNALKWAVREMERRLDYLAKFGARDIDSYNAKAEERMPRIIVIIDELADLMIQNKREVEATVVRIAQMARAAGIHLILATQRPSVDVITGTIKANIPTRLAFAVASQVDSKTILDTAGADKLLGRGDMLMSTPELSKPRRVQGAFVADLEIERVVQFLKKESEPDYNYKIIETGTGAGGVSLDPSDSDPLLDEAAKIALEAGRVSTSYLQRRMKIGYSRAARIVDLLEQLGVVGPADGAKPREVLVDSWPPEEAYDAEEDPAGDFGVEEIAEDEREDRI